MRFHSDNIPQHVIDIINSNIMAVEKWAKDGDEQEDEAVN